MPNSHAPGRIEQGLTPAIFRLYGACQAVKGTPAEVHLSRIKQMQSPTTSSGRVTTRGPLCSAAVLGRRAG